MLLYLNNVLRTGKKIKFDDNVSWKSGVKKGNTYFGSSS